MRTLALLGLLTVAAAAAPALKIGGETFVQADIIDARGLPGLGAPTILITMTPRAAARLATITKANVGRKLIVTFEGRTLSEPVISEAIEGGAMQLTGSFTLVEAIALAKRISGKDPLPDSLEE